MDFGTADDRQTGNVGVRYVNTRTLSNGGIPDSNTVVISKQGSVTTVNTTNSTATSSYGKWLPSLNLRYKFTDALQLRFGAAKVLTRPDLSRLTRAVTIDANVGTIKSGNPNLQPYQATPRSNIISARAVFCRLGFSEDLTTFIIDGTTRETYNVTQKETGVVGPMTFTQSLPANASGSKLKGIEVGAQVTLTFLPGALDGFGIGANATFLDVGELELSQLSGKQPLPGVSKRSFNASAYYEKYGFGARLSYTYRSKYTNSQFGVSGDGNYSKAFWLLRWVDQL